MADSKEEKSWFSQAWDWTRNSLLGRTIGIDDATKAGKESKGLWGETKDLLGIGSSKETTAQKETVAQPETKGLWGWMKNSLLGRTFGLADEGNNEPGLWGMFKNSMIGRTFGLEDEGNNKPGLWGWMKNSMLGRALGLADKKEASANTATAQQTQAQTASNGAVNDDVIVEAPSQYKVVSQEKSNATKVSTTKASTSNTSTATKASTSNTSKAAAPAAEAPKVAKASASNTSKAAAAPTAEASTVTLSTPIKLVEPSNSSSLTTTPVNVPNTPSSNQPITINPTGSYTSTGSVTVGASFSSQEEVNSAWRQIESVKNDTTIDTENIGIYVNAYKQQEMGG